MIRLGLVALLLAAWISTSRAGEISTGEIISKTADATRTRHNAPINFRPGAATIAARTGVDILPIAIRCEPLFLSKQQPWHHVPRERPVFTIRILAPVSTSALVPDSGDERQFRQDLNEAMLAVIRRELDDMEFSRDPH